MSHEPPHETKTTAADAGADATMTTDAVCGKPVPRTSQWFVLHNGETWHLCSLSCALRFKANPDEFTSRQTA